MTTLRRLGLLVIAMAGIAQSARAGEHDALLPYVADDVAAIAVVDLDQVDLPAAVEMMVQLRRVPEADVARARQNASQIQLQVDDFRQRGVGRIYLLLRMSDVAHGGPTCVLPIGVDDNPQKVVEELERLLSQASPRQGIRLPHEAFGQSLPLPRRYSIADGLILAARDADQLDAMKNSRRDPASVREDVRQALNELGRHGAGLVVFGDADSRRVVREMFPQLPAPFGAIDGRMIADGLQWGSLTLDFPPKLHVAAAIQTVDPATATTVAASINKGLDLGKAYLQQMQEKPDQAAAQLTDAVAMLRPEIHDARVTLTLGDTSNEFASLTNLLAQPVRAVRQSLFRQQRMNQFKQISLAMLNYESANGAFPPRAITDEQGRPLLSWRVAILPFMEQKALYEQFHLDEPWDSPHNRKLINTFPKEFVDPDSAISHALVDKGRTTFVVPTGEQTVFHGREGMKIKKITDGLSNTVLVVEVPPKRAVIWTQPDDWELDLDTPFDGVKRSDDRPFTAAFCDGHVRMMNPNHEGDAKNWPKLLTAQGEETVEW